MTDTERARDLLHRLDPAALSYDDWLRVGMACHHVGLSAADWESWSASDRRHQEGECARKWQTFRGNGIPVTMGSLVEIASRHGIKPAFHREQEPVVHFGWDDPLPVGKAAWDARWVEEADIPEPAVDWQPNDLIRYLELVFEPDEKVGIVMQAWHHEESGRWLPQKGVWDRTRSELVDALRQAGKDVGAALGDADPTAGAWIRINPLDGDGCKDANVTVYRHALIEADDADLGRQLALIRELQLPCSAIVHSGGKSIHAIVRVDAKDAAEYRSRVDRLYEICEASGLKVDQANRNPSRLSRLPGVTRNGKPQYLIAGRSGQDSWEAWEAFVEDLHDDLPDPESLADAFANLPPLAPAVITDTLRVGHKLLLTGPSKAGKSFCLIELCAAIAEGRTWFGRQVMQGNVLYVNLELDRASCLHRCHMVYDVLGWAPNNIGRIDIWNLRGHSVPLDKLTPKLIRRAQNRNYLLVVVDPIYKILTGDENSAAEMAAFCGQFDRICSALGAAMVYAHHHSKGEQGHKRSIDRGSGSGVFGRDPDAVLDMIELEIPSDRREAVTDQLAAERLTALAASLGLDLDQVPDDDRTHAAAFLRAFQANWPQHGVKAAGEVYEARVMAGRMSGWRVEGNLREFAPPDPYRCWFRHPLHEPDHWGLLTDAKAAGEEAPWVAERREREESKREKSEAIRAELQAAVEAAGGPGSATVLDVAESLGITDEATRSRIKKSGLYWYKKGLILLKNEGDHE